MRNQCLTVMRSLVIAAAITLPVSLFAEEGDLSLETERQKISYMIAYSVAEEFVRRDMRLDQSAILTAINDIAQANSPRLSQQDMSIAMQQFDLRLQAVNTQRERDTNIAAGQIYLADNAKRDGVTSLNSGVQYEVLVEGAGTKPMHNDRVLLHYKGSFINGDVFEQTNRDAPVELSLNEVIDAWAEVLPLMKQGDKWRVVTPHFLAYPYGTMTIPAGSALVYELELVDVVSL